MEGFFLKIQKGSEEVLGELKAMKSGQILAEMV